MSSSDKSPRVFAALSALILCLLVAACGFAPLYGTIGQDKTTRAGFDTVAIGNIPDASGQYLRNALMDRLYTHGRPDRTQYALNIQSITESRSNLDITKNSTTTRSQLRLNTTMVLTDIGTGKNVLTRSLTAISSFNVLESQYDTKVSEESVRQNALDDLARQVEAQLALYFKR